MIAFPIPKGPHHDLVINLQNMVLEAILPEERSKIELPFPHVTFHKPIKTDDVKPLLKALKGMTSLLSKTRITYSGLWHFGDHYVVLPVHATLTTAAFWVGISSILKMMEGYEHDRYDNDNTLHITLLGKTSKVFLRSWPIMKQLLVEDDTILLDRVFLMQKPITGGSWEPIREFVFED